MKQLHKILLSVLPFLLISPISAEPAEDKPTILITGANRGLGLQLVKEYVAGGYTVYGTTRKPEEATELKETGAQVVQLDVTSEESIAALVETLDGTPLDILFNNAGYYGPNKIGTKMDTIDNLTREEIEFCHAVNTMGPLFVSKALLPNLRAGGQKKIINMSTRSSMLSRSGGGAMGYRISKAGLNMVTVTLASQLKKEGFIVVSVAPGHNKTDMGTDRANLTPEESMPMLKAVIDNLTMEQTGGLWYYDGKRLPW